MALISPGVEVTVIDESQYVPAELGTVANLIIATASDKTTGSGSGTAAGTTAANAGTTYLVGSQRELTTLFGNPTFYQTSAGSALHGYELNEYGLMAAYSLLGISNRCYVTRADLNTAELGSSASRPVGPAANGVVWLDAGPDSKWGIFEWNASTKSFVNKVPHVISDPSDVVGGFPSTSIGAIGDYAVITTNIANAAYYKNRSNNWTLIGTEAWQNSWPTISGTSSNPTLTNAHTIVINGVSVTLAGTTVSDLATSINNASITGVTAAAVDSKIEFYATSSSQSDGATTDGKIDLTAGSGTILTDAGLTAGTYACPLTQVSEHYNVPAWKSSDTTPRPTGSVWSKTTASNLGNNLDISYYSSSAAAWVPIAGITLYPNDWTANKNLDITGGKNIDAGTYYVQTNYQENTTPRLTHRILRRYAKGALEVQGTINAATPITSAEQFTISASIAGSTAMTNAVTVITSGTTLSDLASDINGANVANVSAEVTSDGFLKIKHSVGGVIILKDTVGTPIDDAGISTSITTAQVRAGNDSDLILSNWVSPTYTASVAQPSSDPSNNRYWYNGTLEVDIMIHDGSTWVGYQNETNDARGFNLSNTSPGGVIIGTTEPTEQSDESALVYGDLWLDSGDLENYPMIYRYELVDGEDKWVLIDKGDQTTEDGILFADARWAGDGTTDIVTGAIPSTASLLTNDYLDVDRPDPLVYPRGMLLFNTRRSSYNVKQYKKNYFNRTNFNDTSVYPTLPTEKDCWVTASGNKADGSMYAGRKAVRKMVVSAMKEAMTNSEALRDDARQFNLIACPGYPELITDMVALNNERRNTAHIVGDTPFRLAPNSTAIQNWSLNTAGATDNGEEGIISADQYLSVYYGCGLTTDLGGDAIMQPPSHAILRTIARSDDQSFPWFAAAGTRRGLIDNFTSIGYLNAETGEFNTDNIRESLRDTLYENKINPITFFSGQGLMNYGNKTRSPNASAMDRVNVSRLLSYLRGVMQRAALSFVFEPNDKITRDELKEIIEQFLNDLIAKRALYDYLVICDESNNTPDRIDRNELYVDIAIEPVKAAEFIYIPIRIKNTGEISGANAA